MLRPTCLAVLLPVAAQAQAPADPMAVFRTEPCGAVLESIYVEQAAGTDLGQVFGVVGRRGLYMGIVAGFDLAHGGLQGEAPSTLARLREACEARPEATALELLEGFAAEGAAPD